jgi:hypothetical protein
MKKIKKGNLNYDQSGRAYPDNPELKENWDCIWEHDDKYYELVGDNEHKEWEEVKIYDQIIDDCYKNWISSGKCYKFRRNLYIEPKFEILSVDEVNAEDFPYINSTGFYGFEKYGIEELWINFSKLGKSENIQKFILDGFIYKTKTDGEFANKWGLKIEERELSTQERNEWFQIHLNGNNPFMKSDWKDFELDQQNIPTRLITLMYNNEKIEIYE